MSQYIPQIKKHATRLRLSGIGSNITNLLLEAQNDAPSYDEFVFKLFSHEVKEREAKQQLLRMKLARLPVNHDLEQYDHSFTSGLNPTQLNQLRELNWLDQCYNIMLTGPSGTGKTYISAGLGFDAVQRGYKAYFRNISDILSTLRLKDVSQNAAKEFKRLAEAQLIIIDDVITPTLSDITKKNIYYFTV